MTFRARQPGCPCCDDDCRIDITGWTQSAGTWTITGDNLETASSSALAVTTNEHPEDKSTHYVTVKVKGDTDGDVLRVVVAYADANNYLYAEIEVGTTCGYLRLFQVDGGSAFQLGDDIPSLDLTPGVFHTVRVCYDGETLTAIITNKVSYSQDVAATGTYVGLATGAIDTLATFNDFQWWIHYDDGDYYYGEPNDCPECDSLIPCTIHSDNFNRADSVNVGCTWTEVAGTWEILNEELKTTGGTAINNIPHPLPTQSKLVQASVKASDSGDKFKLLIDSDKNATDYFYAELEIIPGTLQGKLHIGSSAGVIRTVSITTLLDTWYGVCVNVFGNFLQASVGTVTVGQEVASKENDYSGLIATVTTAGYFNNFLFSRHQFDDDECPTCGLILTCTACENSQVTEFYKVLIAGVLNMTCNDCEDINGTWIARRASYVYDPAVQEGCAFATSFNVGRPSYMCNDPYAGMQLELRQDNYWWAYTAGDIEGTTVYWISVMLSGTSSPNGIMKSNIRWGGLWHETDPIKCLELDEFVLGLINIEEGDDWPCYAETTSTVKVTSL